MQASIQQAAQLQATYPRMRPRDRHGVAGTPKMHSVAIAAGGTPLNTANKLCACVRECVRVFDHGHTQGMRDHVCGIRERERKANQGELNTAE